MQFRQYRKSGSQAHQVPWPGRLHCDSGEDSFHITTFAQVLCDVLEPALIQNPVDRIVTFYERAPVPSGTVDPASQKPCTHGG